MGFLLKSGRAPIQAKTDESAAFHDDDEADQGRAGEKKDDDDMWVREKRDGPAKLGKGVTE